MRLRTILLVVGLFAVVMVACGGDGDVSTWTQAGSSMEPTLSHDEEVSIKEYGSDVPERGDIVLYKLLGLPTDRPEFRFLKRVVGLPGETIEVRDQQVLIDGELLDEPYILEPPHYHLAPTTIPAGFYFVLPDNRNSNSSPTLEPISSESISGYVVD